MENETAAGPAVRGPERKPSHPGTPALPPPAENSDNIRANAPGAHRRSRFSFYTHISSGTPNLGAGWRRRRSVLEQRLLSSSEEVPGRREQRAAISAGHRHGDLRACFVQGLGQATAPWAGPLESKRVLLSLGPRGHGRRLCAHTASAQGGRTRFGSRRVGDNVPRRDRHLRPAADGCAPARSWPLAPPLVWQHVHSKCFVNQNQQPPKPHVRNPAGTAGTAPWPACASHGPFF